MGLKFSYPHPPTVRQIKTPVQSVENPKGFGGVIIYDQETFTINKPHLGSFRYVDSQEGISEDTFEEANIVIEPTVKLSVQCVENQRGLCGQIVYYDVLYAINLQPQPDIDDEGIVIDMEED